MILHNNMIFPNEGVMRTCTGEESDATWQSNNRYQARAEALHALRNPTSSDVHEPYRFLNFCDDKEFALEFIKQYPLCFMILIPSIAEDLEVVLEAVKADDTVIEINEDEETDIGCLLDSKLTKDPIEALKLAIAVSKSPDDRELLINAITTAGCVLKYASKELREDKEVVLAALNQNDRALKYADPSIQELCKGKDPIQALEAAIRAEKFQAALPDKLAVKRKKSF